MKATIFFKKVWKWTKRIFIFLFFFQLFCILLFKWVNPPLTMTQLVSWISGDGLKRDYVAWKKISYNAKLSVIASEDQLFPDHSGFDWKNIKKAAAYNKKKTKPYPRGKHHQPASCKKCVFVAGAKLDKKGS